MPPRSHPQQRPRVAGQATPPAFYTAIATIPGPGYDPASGVAPAAAYQPGDRVPAGLVEEYGWADLVEPPGGGQPPPAIEAGPGQGPGSEEQ